jgi:hypothetical protein
MCAGVVEQVGKLRDLVREQRNVVVFVVKRLRVLRSVTEKAIARVARDAVTTKRGRERMAQ